MPAQEHHFVRFPTVASPERSLLETVWLAADPCHARHAQNASPSRALPRDEVKAIIDLHVRIISADLAHPGMSTVEAFCHLPLLACSVVAPTLGAVDHIPFGRFAWLFACIRLGLPCTRLMIDAHVRVLSLPGPFATRATNDMCR